MIAQSDLRRVDLLPRSSLCVEPFAPVHLREGDPPAEPPARAAGPLGAHHVAPGLPRVGLPLPRVHELVGILADAAKRQERSFGPDARLFLELADGPVANEASPASTGPLGKVQAPRSRSSNNGPPRWARKTYISTREGRDSNSPAYVRARFAICTRGEPQHPW